MAELELPIKIIIDKIKSRIENGEYGLIIGDDASGRVPALIPGNFIKKVSESKGLDKPDIIFIPGKPYLLPILDRTVNVPKLEKYLSKYEITKDKRILIVTDTVLSGNSLAVLVRLLGEIGFTCDIATVGVETEEKDVADRNKKLQNFEVISGEYHNEDSHMPNTPRIYKEKTLSGVTKKVGQTKSTTLKSTESNEDDKEIIQDQINQAREDANVVTQHLIDWYESRTKSSSSS